MQWLQAMGLAGTQANGSRVLALAQTGEDMVIITRLATAFGLEMNNFSPTGVGAVKSQP
jgi:hypothetical protein